MSGSGVGAALAVARSYLGGKYYLFGFRVRLIARFRRYDFCHAMEAMALFAARGFAARGIPVLLDVNEIPDPFERQGARFVAAEPAVKRHLARAFARDQTGAAALIATSDAMADFVAERFGRDAIPIRNARNPLEGPPSAAIRDDAAAGRDSQIMVYPCTAAPHLGVETAIELLRLLQDSYRLVFVGRFVTPAYQETIERLIRRHRLERRVLLKGELAEADYLRYLAGADVGLVPLSFRYRNQRIVLPWRVIDLAAAGVPIVATPSEAVCQLARHYDLGEVAAGIRADDLAEAVRRLAAATPERRAAIGRDLRAMAIRFSPAREADRYRAVIGALASRRSGRAAFVCNMAIRANRRLIAFIDEICDLGWRVDLYCVRAPDPALFKMPARVRAIAVSDRLVPRWLDRGWLAARELARRLPAMAIPRRLGGFFLGLWFGLRLIGRVRRFAKRIRQETARRGGWDVVIACDVFALPAARGAAHDGSMLVYDATETPDLRQRTAHALRAIPAPLRLVFRRWERRSVNRAGLVLATSHPFARYLRRRYRGRMPVVAIRNTAGLGADPAPGAMPASLRDRLGLAPDDVILVSPCGISAETGALVAVRMLAFLPKGHVLVFIGRFSHPRAEAEVRRLLHRLRLEHRCFFLGELAYPAYLRSLADCDIGLVLFDPAIANMRLSAPNRFFDLIAAGVPMVATEIEAVAAVLRRAGTGMVLRSRRPAAAARAVMAVRAALGIVRGGAIDPAARAKLDRLARHYGGDAERRRLVDALAARIGPLPGKRVALMTLRGAAGSRRLLRLGTALRGAGAEVAAFATDLGPAATAPPAWLTMVPILRRAPRPDQAKTAAWDSHDPVAGVPLAARTPAWDITAPMEAADD